MRLMLRSASKMVAGLALVAGLAACAPAATPAPTAVPTAAADMGAMGAVPTVPAGLAYAEGQEIRFIMPFITWPGGER